VAGELPKPTEDLRIRVKHKQHYADMQLKWRKATTNYKEVENAMEKLQNNKSPGVDNQHAELLKYGDKRNGS
jgi:hypothetical protein